MDVEVADQVHVSKRFMSVVVKRAKFYVDSLLSCSKSMVYDGTGQHGAAKNVLAQEHLDSLCTPFIATSEKKCTLGESADSKFASIRGLPFAIGKLNF